MSGYNVISKVNESNSLNYNFFNKNPNRSGFWELNSISIDGPGGWAWAVSQPWCNGSGSLNHPYIIENITINNRDGSGTCLSIKNSNAYFIVRNCTYYSASTGIKLESIEYGSLINNTCYNNSFCGIYLLDSSYCHILNNTIYDNGYDMFSSIPENFPKGGGIALWSSHNNTIQDNCIQSNEDFGIALGDTITEPFLGGGTNDEPCYNNTVSRNFFNKTSEAIWILPESRDNIIVDNKIIKSSIFLEGSFETKIINNTILDGIIWFRGSIEAETSYYIDKNNKVNGKPVYYYSNETGLNKYNFTNAGQVLLVNCENSFIENASFNMCRHITLSYCSDISLIENEMNCGIFLDQTNNSKIIRNKFNQINLYYAYNNSILENFLNTTLSYTQLTLRYSNENNVSRNIFLNNKNGFFLFDSHHNELSKNLIELHKDISNSYLSLGISLERSYHNTISENDIINPDICINLKGSCNNTLYKNFMKETEIGIRFEYSNYNIVLSNNIIATNACFQIDIASEENLFENNSCNEIPSEQRIPGIYPSLILLCILSISFIYYNRKKYLTRIM